jgi:multidrug efflux pump subunit AcrA (membrane-fusion protein)
MQNETHRPDADLLSGKPPRGLRTAGIVAGVLAVAVVAAGLYTRHGEALDASAWSEQQAVPTVHLITANPVAANGDLTLPGTMAAWNTAHIFARVAGYMQSWDRDIGAAVEQGTPLARIETPNSTSRSSPRGPRWPRHRRAPRSPAAPPRAGTTC